ncbi:MAG: thiolase family protein [Candidatus Hydrogenedentes bacterium]|nr:thiolase family protein [Candidatus Hydrogenedentota bacterium]
MQDVYVVSAARTAVGKANRGTLARFRPDEMAAAVIRAAVERAGIGGDRVQDVVLGCAFPESAQGMNVARVAVARAGLPDAVPAMTINRFCSSGLEAIHIAAGKIRSGSYDVALAGGVESMSLIPMGGFKISPNPYLTETRPEVYTGMGVCGDNVARTFNITREEADEWALRSHAKAVAAIDAGKFKEEIVPLEVPTADGGTVTFDTDEGPRRDTSPEALAKLRPAFAASPKIGICTAGNSSQTSDGAAAVCLMSEAAVKETGATPLAKLGGYAAAAGSPDLLGPAQLEAVPKACALSGIALDEVDVIEHNEAFASQCLYVIREMPFDTEKVNVNGGAIALGHPLGCTGAKLTVQIIHELRRRGAKYGLVTMCIGGGMGAAGVFELCE